MARATLFHQLHDVGLAAWFGGTLANAVALNPAASSGGDSARVGAVANEGWDRWTPVNAVAIGAHLIIGTLCDTIVAGSLVALATVDVVVGELIAARLLPEFHRTSLATINGVPFDGVVIRRHA